MSYFKKTLGKLYSKHGITDSNKFLKRIFVLSKTQFYNPTLNFDDGW